MNGIFKKMEGAAKAAQDALETLTGPFRLRKAVRSALNRGMLLPFPVSVQRGKAIARLERGQNMREVSVRLFLCVCVCISFSVSFTFCSRGFSQDMGAACMLPLK